MRKPTQQQRRFIESLNARANDEDRAALAALRRGLGKAPGTIADTHRYVAPWLPNNDDPFAPWVQRQQDAYYLVASLFAAHQEDVWSEQRDSRQMNLGWSFRQLAQSSDSGSIDQRFATMLNSRADDLPQHLQHAISLLKAHDVRINWAQLLVDIQDWDNDDRSVQRGWAQAFWGAERFTPDDAKDSDESSTAATAAATNA